MAIWFRNLWLDTKRDSSRRVECPNTRSGVHNRTADNPHESVAMANTWLDVAANIRAADAGRKNIDQASLTMSSPVNHFLDVLTRALRRARHFALVEGSAIPTKGSLVIVSGQNSVRPMHLFGHNFDHDYYFELLCEEERAAQSISRCSTAHHRLFR